MSMIQVRPSFQVPLDWDGHESARRLQAAFRLGPLCDRGEALGKVAEVSVPQGEERLWSPHLSLVIDDSAEDETLLRGRFAPRPAVWTGVMLIYFSGFFLILCGLFWAYAQWAMQQQPWALVSFPVGLCLLLAVYLISFAGQRLSSHQMDELHALTDRAIELMRDLPSA